MAIIPIAHSAVCHQLSPRRASSSECVAVFSFSEPSALKVDELTASVSVVVTCCAWVAAFRVCLVFRFTGGRSRCRVHRAACVELRHLGYDLLVFRQFRVRRCLLGYCRVRLGMNSYGLFADCLRVRLHSLAGSPAPGENQRDQRDLQQPCHTEYITKRFQPAITSLITAGSPFSTALIADTTGIIVSRLLVSSGWSGETFAAVATARM